MKKGFTMIELIFVIVILGILASVAIPRLAATREDAEISAAVANLRTLVSYVSAYYVVKGSFGTDSTARNSTIKWNEITNVPLKPKNDSQGVFGDGVLKVGDQDCILVALRDKDNTKPAHIVIAKQSGATGVCQQVQNAEPLKAYFTSKVNGQPKKNDVGFMAIVSSTSIYDEQTTTSAPSS